MAIDSVKNISCTRYRLVVFLPGTLKILVRRKGGESRMLGNLGTTELLVIGLVVLLFFGGKKLPELARGFGDSIKEFKKAAKEA